MVDVGVAETELELDGVWLGWVRNSGGMERDRGRMVSGSGRARRDTRVRTEEKAVTQRSRTLERRFWLRLGFAKDEGCE